VRKIILEFVIDGFSVLYAELMAKNHVPQLHGMRE
jgi:hypothetical protein